MRKIKKIHEKEIKALEWKCSVKNERLYGRPPDRRRQEFRDSLNKIMQQEAAELEPPMFGGRPRSTAGSAKSRQRREREESADFLKLYNGLNQLEKQTNKKLSTVTLEAKGNQHDKSVAEQTKKVLTWP